MSSCAERFHLFVLKPDVAAASWYDLEPTFGDVVARSLGRMSLDAIRDNVVSGWWLVWTVWDEAEKISRAWLLTEVYTAPSGIRCFRIVSCSGDDPTEWVHLIDEMKKAARAMGAQNFEMLARSGWQKILGRRASHVLIEETL